MLRRLHHAMTGLMGLLILVIRYRGRFRNSYWRWRHETAFGADQGRGAEDVDQWWAILDFGAWVWQMRRL